MTIAPPAVTKPDAGVMATSRATAPAAARTTLHLRLWSQLARTHVSVAAPAAVFVTSSALAAWPLAESADPALNPNQPNQRRPAPRTTRRMSCGAVDSFVLATTRGPMRRATTRAETPELMWTTVPPAKSSAPSLWSQPSGAQTQWASGEY